MLIFLDLHLGPPPPNLDLLSVSLRRRLRKTPPPPPSRPATNFSSHISSRLTRSPADFKTSHRISVISAGLAAFYLATVSSTSSLISPEDQRRDQSNFPREGRELKKRRRCIIESTRETTYHSVFYRKKKKKTIVDHLVIPRKRNLINRTTFNRYSFHRS